MQKYQESFDTPKDEIPLECPICKHEFNLQEDVEIDSVKNGYKSTLHCHKCKFKKVLSFTTDKDVEELDNNDESYDEDYE